MRIQIVAAMFLLAGPAQPQRVQHGAADVTVQLFSTERVTSIRATGTSATQRTCPSCKQESVASPLEIRSGTGPGQMTVNGRLVRELDVQGRLQIKTSGGHSADAAGVWKFTAAAGELHAVVTIPSERYVMAVLVSEGAPDEPLESLKALAVTARSFALANLHRHGEDGLCDSTHCQALRLEPVSARIEQAVRETAGERLWWHGLPVPGYFTQSSGGVTEDAARVWGGAEKPWLTSHPDPFCAQQPSQWHAEITEQQLREALQAEGWRLHAPVEQIRVLERDPAGRAGKLQIIAGTQRIVLPASALRFAVDRDLGWNRLRSDWYEVHILHGLIVFDGKGYGHGVGLCQAGGQQMARQGKNYRTILASYFPGTEVRVEASDMGWQHFSGSGWMLRATAPEPTLLAAGDAALREAHSRWQNGGGVQPTVTLFPSTELFRVATGDPGWTLASTRGEDIGLQPLEVVQRHSSVRDLLLHEFLHSLVEQEASEQAPLWLREGLVELLAGPQQALPRSVSPLYTKQIESALATAKTLADARRAHDDARLLVQQLVVKYGMQTVRDWLRSGVPAAVVAGQ